MGQSIKRDSYRKIITELQSELGIKLVKVGKLTNKKACIEAICNIVKLSLQTQERKEIDKYIETNRALNDINCELKRENQELKDKILELEFKINQKNEEYIFMKQQLKEYQESLEIRQNNFDNLLSDFNNVKKQKTKILIISILIIIGVMLWKY